MRFALLAFYSVLIMATSAMAQCVGTIQSLEQDQNGAIRVVTQYSMNGQPVLIGGSRYNEQSGTEAEIIQRAKDDVKSHCEALISRLEVNRATLAREELKRQKVLTKPIMDSISPQLIGQSITVNSYKWNFKGKEITVNADGTNSVTDVPYTPVIIQ